MKEEKISFTCLEGVREEKIKENNIFKIDICFYLNTPIKSKILVLVMDIIEILNVISGRPQKLHYFYLAFFEKNGPPKSCTLFIWLSLRKLGLNGCSFLPFSLLFFPIMLTKQEKLSCQHNFLSFLFSLFSFLPPFPNKALILIIVVVVVLIIIIGTILLLWLYEYDKRHLTIYNKLCWHDSFLCLIGIIGKKRGEDRRNEHLSRPTFSSTQIGQKWWKNYIRRMQLLRAHFEERLKFQFYPSQNQIFWILLGYLSKKKIYWI